MNAQMVSGAYASILRRQSQALLWDLTVGLMIVVGEVGGLVGLWML